MNGDERRFAKFGNHHQFVNPMKLERCRHGIDTPCLRGCRHHHKHTRGAKPARRAFAVRFHPATPFEAARPALGLEALHRRIRNEVRRRARDQRKALSLQFRWRVTEIRVMKRHTVVNAVVSKRAARQPHANVLRFNAHAQGMGELPSQHHQNRADAATHVQIAAGRGGNKPCGEPSGEQIVQRPPVAVLALKHPKIAGEITQIFVHPRTQIGPTLIANRLRPAGLPTRGPAGRAHHAWFGGEKAGLGKGGHAPKISATPSSAHAVAGARTIFCTAGAFFAVTIGGGLRPSRNEAGQRFVMLTCQQFFERVNAHLDGALPEAQMPPLRAHAQACESCARHWEQSQALVKSVKRVGQRPVAILPAPQLLAALAARQAHPMRAWSDWLKRVLLAAAVAVSAALALNPAASAPAAGPHMPCSWVVLGAAFLPVAVVWAAFRRRGQRLTMQGAAAVGAVGALAGQLLVGMGCPDAHVQRHLLLSHFAALVMATALSAAWARWAPQRAPLPR